jgi:hypothetical protein
MDKKILEHIQARVEEDEDQQKLFCAYDDMDTMKWTPPTSLLKDWVRVRVNTDPHDALKTMANIFDTYNPKWEILPLGLADADRAEELETWLEYHMQKANQNGETSPFREGLHTSGKFNRTIYHVDYLPYWLPKDKKSWSKEQKINAVNGPFCIEAIDPRTAYYEVGKYGLRWIAIISNSDGQAIIDHWGGYESDTEEGKQIKRGLAKIKSIMDDDEEVDFIYVDYVSHEKRCCSAFKTTRDGIEDFDNLVADEAIDILTGKNELGFIPYAVATGDSDPLLHSMHVGGVWENQNMIETIVDSSVLRRAFFPLMQHTSISGKDVDINYDGSQDVVELTQGEAVQTMVPPPIDQGLQQLASLNSQRMGKSAGIKNLGLQDIAGNVQFSTVQAQVQLQLTALQPYKRTDEKALVQAAYLMFRWLDFADGTEVAYRKNPKKEGQFKGEGIALSKGDFDPDVMIISCELLSNSPTDKQQLVNMYSTLKQAGAQIAWGELLERLQLGNPEMLKQGWLDEQLEGSALKDFVDEQAAKLQLQVEQKKMEIQAALQQRQMQQQQQAQQAAQQPSPEQMAMLAQQGGGSPPQGDAVMPGGQENNPAAGGQPPMTAAPGMTRNNVRQPG